MSPSVESVFQPKAHPEAHAASLGNRRCSGLGGVDFFTSKYLTTDAPSPMVPASTAESPQWAALLAELADVPEPTPAEDVIGLIARRVELPGEAGEAGARALVLREQIWQACLALIQEAGLTTPELNPPQVSEPTEEQAHNGRVPPQPQPLALKREQEVHRKLKAVGAYSGATTQPACKACSIM